MLAFIRYIEVHFTFGLLDCACYNEDFVISRFRYVEVLFRTFYCNFGRADEYRSLYQGLRSIEVR